MVVVTRLNSISKLIIAEKCTSKKNKCPDHIQIVEIVHYPAGEMKPDVGHGGNHKAGGGNVLPDVEIPEPVRTFFFHSLIQLRNKGKRKSGIESIIYDGAQYWHQVFSDSNNTYHSFVA